MIEEIKYYRIVCDKCHCGFIDEHYISEYREKYRDLLIQRARKDGWVIDNSKCICFECAEKLEKSVSQQ